MHNNTIFTDRSTDKNFIDSHKRKSSQTDVYQQGNITVLVLVFAPYLQHRVLSMNLICPEAHCH